MMQNIAYKDDDFIFSLLSVNFWPTLLFYKLVSEPQGRRKQVHVALFVRGLTWAPSGSSMRLMIQPDLSEGRTEMY